MKKLLLLAILLGILGANLSAQHNDTETDKNGIYVFTPQSKLVFHDVLNLKFNLVRMAMPALKKENDFNLMPYYIEDYHDFLEALLDGRPQKIYGKYKDNMEKRIEKIQTGDPSDPYYLFVQGDIYLRWGLIYAIYGDNMEAFKIIKKGAALLEKNNEKFPKFIPNKRALGILHTMVGAMPGQYKWGTILSKLKGDVNKGLTELQEVIAHGKKVENFEFNEEVQIIYSLLLLYMGNQDNTAWGALNTALMDYTANPMAAYILASRSLKTGKSKKAILILDRCPKGDDYYHVAYLDLLRGLSQLYQLNIDAEDDFKRFIEKNRGVNHVKEVYQYLAWVSILKGNKNEYKYNIGQVEKKGELNTFADRTAMNEMEDSKDGIVPDLKLLQARLLFEGGSYEKSLVILEQCKLENLKTEEYQLEHTFRKARVLHLMRKNEDAMKLYESVWAKGNKKPYYYACSAALFMGQIWEVRKEWEKAEAAYLKCLKEKPDQYKVSLHSKANKCLSSLEGKLAHKKKKKH